MKRIAAIGLVSLALVGSALAQDKIRVTLTLRSNVSTSEIGKGLDKRCPNVILSDAIVLSDNTSKARYALEAWNTGDGPGRKPYKFTLFSNGDRMFSTETRGINGAVKDVCDYIQKH
jgi:hypothetical protein